MCGKKVPQRGQQFASMRCVPRFKCSPHVIDDHFPYPVRTMLLMQQVLTEYRGSNLWEMLMLRDSGDLGFTQPAKCDAIFKRDHIAIESGSGTSFIATSSRFKEWRTDQVFALRLINPCKGNQPVITRGRPLQRTTTLFQSHPPVVPKTKPETNTTPSRTMARSISKGST